MKQMKQAKVSIGMLAAAVLVVSVLAASPVSARHGMDDSTLAAQQTTTDNSATGSGSKNRLARVEDDSTQAESETGAHHLSTEAEHLGQDRSAAAKELAALRKNKAGHTVAQRQKLCQNRQVAVDNKVKAFGTAADKHLTRLNGVFTKLQAYQTEKKLDVSNYQALVDAATAKQTAATSAVTALKTVSVNIDCTSTDPASSLTVVKTAAKDTRTALKDYRKSLKDIVVALAQAKAAAKADDTTTTEGAN